MASLQGGCSCGALRYEGGVPAFEIFYDMNTHWPAENLARRDAAAAAAKKA